MNKKGFTLIELLVVVLIIGILSAVALPQYYLAVDKARYSTLMSVVKAIKNAQELFYLENERYALTWEELGEDSIPAGAIITNSDAKFKKFTVSLGGLYVPCVWASNGKNSYLMWNNHSSSQTKIACYGYTIGGDRAKRLCKSLGGIQTGTGCDSGGDCVMYKLQ